jgi:hypothetical protein
VNVQSNPSGLEGLPVSLKPIYSTDEVNICVHLYSGKFELVHLGSTFTGDGGIQLDWLPRPRLWFHLYEVEDDRQIIDLFGGATVGKALLRLVDISQEVEVVVIKTHILMGRMENRSDPLISGIINEFNMGCGDNLQYIMFHVVNFRDYNGVGVRNESTTTIWNGRAMIEAGDWRVTLDKRPGGNPLFEELKALSGYAITHIGKLERIDGRPFSVDDADEMREALYRYLSFCSGFWVAPILLVGFDASGNKVFEQWRSAKIERWRNVSSWFNDMSTNGLTAGFPGFLERWRDETWNEPLLLALHWYGEANMSAGGVEGSVILAQAAFEVLAWTLLVEDKQVLSEDGFQKLPAMDKLRLLISDCGIPLGIPTSLSHLMAIAGAENWKDGPQALTEIRNALVHSNPKKRRKVLGASAEVRHDASDLSLWYLELVLLRIFGYQGEYADRLVRGVYRGGEIRSVSWK